MSAAIPPRELAAGLIATAVARCGRIAALLVLLGAGFMVVDLPSSVHAALPLWLPLGMLAAMAALLVFVLLRPRPLSGALYLGLGTVAVVVFDRALLSAEPGLHANAAFVLNRPVFALVLVGGVSAGYLSALLWTLAGFVLGTAAAVAAQLSLGIAPNLGWGPVLICTAYVVIVLALEGVRRRGRTRIPDFVAIDAETARLERERAGENRVAALIHDTALSDLAAIISSADRLDEHSRHRLRQDVSVLVSSLYDTAPGAALSPELARGELHNDLLELVSDFQWRGLSVEVSGEATEIVSLSPRTREAIVAATRAALDNVVEHSGSMSAEIVFERTVATFEIMIVDDGLGFDPGRIGPDRLGIRSSIEERVASVGGRVRLWSSPSAGTSVYISVPLGAVPPATGAGAPDEA